MADRVRPRGEQVAARVQQPATHRGAALRPQQPECGDCVGTRVVVRRRREPAAHRVDDVGIVRRRGRWRTTCRRGARRPRLRSPGERPGASATGAPSIRSSRAGSPRRLGSPSVSAPPGVADAVTVMIACTSRAPTGRYSFWYTAAAKGTTGGAGRSSPVGAASANRRPHVRVHEPGAEERHAHTVGDTAPREHDVPSHGASAVGDLLGDGGQRFHERRAPEARRRR